MAEVSAGLCARLHHVPPYGLCSCDAECMNEGKGGRGVGWAVGKKKRVDLFVAAGMWRLASSL